MVNNSSQLTEKIGKTPLIFLKNLGKVETSDAQIWAKAEWLNPGGSIKDRPALNMIQQVLKDGKLTKGKVILDATSGNTGIALAMIGSALGFSAKLCLPENAS